MVGYLDSAKPNCPGLHDRHRPRIVKPKLIFIIYYKLTISFISYRSLATGLGTFLQLIILMITLIVFQVFKPTELAEKGKLFFKLIGCILGLLFCIGFGVNINEDPNANIQDSKEFFFLVAYIGIITILGWILPGVFITSYPSLQRVFERLISGPLLGLLTLCRRIQDNRIYP